MAIRLKKFPGLIGYYSFAKTIQTSEKSQREGHRVLLWLGDKCWIFPDGIAFDVDEKEQQQLAKLNEWDVLSFDKAGYGYRVCASGDDENAIVTTLACNCNCIMCPVSENQRSLGEVMTAEELIEFASYIPDDIRYLTITGGEPFLVGESIFAFLSYLKEKFRRTEFQVLTNGRVFANAGFAERYVATHPDHVVTGIPIHGYNSNTHDYIMQTPGSFEQTLLGIKHLLYYDENIEIRFVVSRLNADFITQMAELIVREIPGVASVKVMGLEMLGNAAVNQDRVWIDYRTAFEKSREGIDLLLRNGIDVELYNFPLCTVDRDYWGIYRRSITGYKIKYLPACDECVEKDVCGGIFGGTLRLVKEVFPIKD